MAPVDKPTTTPPTTPPTVLVMGVCGCGKSTIGAQLAQRLGVTYLEGDAYHPPVNVERMRSGYPLTDDDRAGWLVALAQALTQHQPHGVVLSCSALKRRYRDVLRASAPGLRIVLLHGSQPLLQARLAARQHHYMPATLLASQLATLELPDPDEHATVLDIAAPVADLVQAAQDAVTRAAPQQSIHT
jgi:gluconokinase